MINLIDIKIARPVVDSVVWHQPLVAVDLHQLSKQFLLYYLIEPHPLLSTMLMASPVSMQIKCIIYGSFCDTP